MLHKIDLDDDTSELLESLANLAGLNVGELVDRLLSAHLAGLHELLALVQTYPELRDQGANLLVSFGPEPLAVGIKRIAPPNYETLAERFVRSVG